MKLAIKIVLAGTVLAAGAAQAANITNLPSSTVGGNGSDLVLFITDTTTGSNFYAKDLGVRVDSLVSKSTTATDGALNATTSLGSFNLSTSLGFGADANIKSFFDAHPGDTFAYSVLAADSSGSNNNAGARRFAGTYSTDISLQGPTSANVSTAAIAANSFYLNLQSDTVTFPSTTNGWGAAGTPGQNAPNSFLSLAYANGSTVGTAMSMYLMATHGANQLANVYVSANTLTLNADGSLTVTAINTPIPAAVWLFGSGLLGLAGIGRRRRLAA